jgi:ornithine carbamoyltransferase
MVHKLGDQKDLLKLSDFSGDHLLEIINRAVALKKMWREKKEYFPLLGKTLGLVFEHSSTRTRVAFQVGMAQLGGNSIFLSAKDTQIGRGESMADTARVLSRYVNAMAARLDGQDDLEELATYADIPVINALTKERHPCQILADLLTIQEHFGSFQDAKVVYVGDSNNVSNSWIEAAWILGFPLVVSTPAQFKPDFQLILGGQVVPDNITWVENAQKAVKDARVLSTDVWVSMGTDENEEKKKILRPYQINESLIEKSSSEVIVLHCLPAHRGEEITHEAMEGPHSQVFHQAENKLHVQKAVLDLFIH